VECVFVCLSLVLVFVAEGATYIVPVKSSGEDTEEESEEESE